MTKKYIVRLDDQEWTAGVAVIKKFKGDQSESATCPRSSSKADADGPGTGLTIGPSRPS